MKAALYARFSTDVQRAASIEDQFRNCRKRAESRFDVETEGTPMQGVDGIGGACDSAKPTVLRPNALERLAVRA